MRRALLSVSDKDRDRRASPAGLQELGVEIVSTGGTARELAGAGLEVRAIEDFTGFPEIMDGRVKTLHPRLYAGLLARRDEEAHLRAAAEQGIEQVDLVCVNLYPFEQTIARGDASEAGGDREHRHRRPDDDPGGRQEQRLRRRRRRPRGLRAPCWRSCASRDGRLSLQTRTQPGRQGVRLHRPLRRGDRDLVRQRDLRGLPADAGSEAYEKVQRPALRREPPPAGGLLRARRRPDAPARRASRQLHGKELSFNNLLDLSSARELVEEFDEAGVRDRQAQQPVRLRDRRSAPQAYERAFACDPQSAYGGVIAVNRRVDRALRRALAEQFIEVLLAPGFDEDALELLSEKKNVRLLELADWPEPSHRDRGQAGARRAARAEPRRRSQRRASRCAC